MLVAGYLCDMLLAKTSLRKVTARKVCMLVASLVPAVFVGLAGYVGCNANAAVVCFMLSIAGNAFMGNV